MSELNGTNNRDYSKFDKMSTEALEELLRLDSQLPNEDDSDIDAILYITEVIQKRTAADSIAKYSVDVEHSWSVFQEKYLPYAQNGRSLYEDDETIEAVAAPVSRSAPNDRGQDGFRKRRAAHFLPAAAIFMVLLCIMTAYAVGYDLWGAVANWTEEIFIFDSEPSPSAASSEYEDLQAALDAYGITEKFVPTWIPDGFTIAEVTVDGVPNSKERFFSCRYVSDRGSIVIAITTYVDSMESKQGKIWQKDRKDVRILKWNHTDVYIMTNLERPAAIWIDGPFECCISGNVSAEELERIVKSID